MATSASRIDAGKRVRHWRELRNLSQSDLADRAKMDNAKLSRIETGKMRPRVEDIESLARALDVTMAEFFGEAA